MDVIDAGVTATRNEPIEIADDIAVRLLDQPANWAKAPTGKLNKDGES